MVLIPYVYENGHQGYLSVDKYPDSCPLCHRQIIAIRHQSFLDESKLVEYGEAINFFDDCLQIIFECPNKKCKGVFVGLYSQPFLNDISDYFFTGARPWNSVRQEFSDIICSISKDFTLVYNQSSAAEQHGFNLVCGVGYRKSLEFLMKDYLIEKYPEEAEAIKATFLGNLIEKRVDNQNIKAVAKRAIWLGNDETHYERKWIEKDVQDLKMLIDLTVKWIEAEKLTERLLKDMPELSQ